ncbi:hypothetical protein HOI26_05435 [Candidatus Woesearchaeota archaeon]|nr:hypothetical protein [Candidatus Woesearchaeota archaeon]
MQIFTKKSAEGVYGKPPAERSTEELLKYSVINIDKPKGPTSHQISDYVKKLLKVNKAGHSGTLDPAVTGVQPIGVERATRITQFLLTAPKEYVCVMYLHKDFPEETIRTELNKFIGKIQQLPPIKSAVKRQIRTREIYELEIIEINKREVLFRVKCQAGTYIRKLCLHPKTQLLTSNGSVKALDFFSNPFSVYTNNEGKMIKNKASAVQKIISPKKLVKLTMDSGVKICVTKDHELLKSTKMGYKMIESQNLKIGDYLVKSRTFPKDSVNLIIADLLDEKFYIQQPNIKEKCKEALIRKYGSIREASRKLKIDRKVFLKKSNHAITIKHLKLAGIYEKTKKSIHTFKTQKGSIVKLKKLNKDALYILGLVASDGNNTKEKKTVRHTRIKFHNKEEKLIDIFIKTNQKLFPNILVSKKKIRPTLFEVDIANSFFATIAANLGVKSPQKEANFNTILNLKPELIKAFLKGYFDGDGSVYCKKTLTNHKSKICFHTVCNSSAQTLHKMLLKVGISNKIFYRKSSRMYEVSTSNIACEKKFIKLIGSNHPKKLQKFKEVQSLKYNASDDGHLLIGFHFKEKIRKNKKLLKKLGGNLHRVLSSKVPVTTNFYRSAKKLSELPPLDDFVIEKIKSIEKVKGTNYVYDLTVPKTHNFLIESGFVSSNCHDIGQTLNSGAHMVELRRTQAGPFTEKDNLVTLNDLQDALHYYREENNDKYLRHCLQPIENALKYLPKCWILDTTIESLTHGRDLGIPGISKLENFRKGEAVAIMTLKGELVAIGEAAMSAVAINTQDKGIGITVKKVFMSS